MKSLTPKIVEPPAEDVVAQQIEAVVRMRAEREKIEDELRRLPAVIDAAIIAGEDALADRLEVKQAAGKRTLRRLSLSLPIIEEVLFEAQAVRRAARVKDHLATARVTYSKVSAAVDALVAANEEAYAGYGRAVEELGAQAAEIYVPLPKFAAALGVEEIAHWKLATALELGLQTRAESPTAPGECVTFLQMWRCFSPGEGARIPADEAHSLVKQGFAVYQSPETVVVPRDPRNAEPTEPDANGAIVVLMVATQLPYNVGEVVGLKPAEAAHYVKRGIAHYLSPDQVAAMHAESAS